MLIDPPIDKMVEKVGCRYALVSIVSKRAHVLQQRFAEDETELENSYVSMAAKDLYEELNAEPVVEIED